MKEADELFAARLAEDLAQYLGPQIELLDLELGDPDARPARIRATFLVEAAGREVLETDGETRLDAYNQLIFRVAELRLIVAVRGFDAEAIEGLAAAWPAGFTPKPR